MILLNSHLRIALTITIPLGGMLAFHLYKHNFNLDLRGKGNMKFTIIHQFPSGHITGTLKREYFAYAKNLTVQNSVLY